MEAWLAQCSLKKTTTKGTEGRREPYMRLLAPITTSLLPCADSWSSLLSHPVPIPTPIPPRTNTHSYPTLYQYPILSHLVPIPTPIPSCTNTHSYPILYQYPLLSHLAPIPTPVPFCTYINSYPAPNAQISPHSVWTMLTSVIVQQVMVE